MNVSRLLVSNESGKLSAGLTLQIMKGVSGAYLSLRQVTYQEFVSGPDTAYIFTGGSGKIKTITIEGNSKTQIIDLVKGPSIDIESINILKELNK